MSKHSDALADDAKTPATAPKVSNTPTITSTGSVYWNVRDIVYKPTTLGGDSKLSRSNSSSKK
jgi:hypothetical protein